MSSRNMKEANIAVFSSLDQYCLSRAEPISNAGQPRWIKTSSFGRRFLKCATLVDELAYSATLKTARFDLANRAYFVTSGFDVPEAPDRLRTEGLDGGLLTTFLAEIAPSPVAQPSEIHDVVGFADKTYAPDYEGHDPSLVASLYPKIQVFSIQDLLKEESFKVFFIICLSDRRIEQWIDAQLAETLNVVTKSSPTAIPYETLCRSILDMDPSALFLALYRCLEALYAHTQTHQLMTALDMSKPWTEMAQTLEETLGWYPREEPSLEALLQHAAPENLQEVVSALDDTIPDGTRSSSYAAKRIYQLRNALVHYRPFHRSKSSFKHLDWNRLCEAMVLLVVRIYGEVNKSWEQPTANS